MSDESEFFIGQPSGDEVEFDCPDCGAHVFVIGYVPKPAPIRCGTCQWVLDYIPENEREAVRKLLHKDR